MGNSTRTLQQVVDGVVTIGDLTPVFTNTGGYANEPALTIANAVMSDLIAARFNWKWNRLRLPPFPLTSNQQDYASVSLNTIGWIESAAVVDVNSTSFPRTTWPVEAVRDLDISNFQASPPGQVAWMPNSLLEYGTWPGANVPYVNPVGALTTPSNPPTNITDANGTILVLSTYGTTGTTPPLALGSALPGSTVADGTCVWTIADPSAQGFRVNPTPPSAGNVWLLRVFAQAKARRFTQLSQTLDPIPDDYSKWFEDGFIAYAHRHSATPSVKAQFPQMQVGWLKSMDDAIKQADRETESKGFYPDRTVVAPGSGWGPTVGNPTNMRRW